MQADTIRSGRLFTTNEEKRYVGELFKYQSEYRSQTALGGEKEGSQSVRLLPISEKTNVSEIVLDVHSAFNTARQISKRPATELGIYDTGDSLNIKSSREQ